MYCAIDFGTSNSAIAVPGRASGGARLVELETCRTAMPTAVFYFAEQGVGGGVAVGSAPPCTFGRAAVAAYVDGYEGRLMRSMKSILGSPLVEQTTDVGGGRGMKYLDIVAGYLRHLKQRAEADIRAPLRHAVIGRPVFFVDDDTARDADAERALESAARRVGFDEIRFQYEPIAAAFDHERSVSREEIVLVADIGGGTSDFSVVRVGPERARATDRKADILANHGVHVAGTDFDRRIELAAVLPAYGFGAYGPSVAGAPGRQAPSAVYHDLATWHLINTVYTPARVAELRGMRGFYADPRHHERLMTAIDECLGHELAARAEAAKIDVASGGHATIDLGTTERGLTAALSEAEAAAAIEADVVRIVDAAQAAAQQAGVGAGGIDALYFTGGSTGLRGLAARIAAAFPAARVVQGDRSTSVATGLGIHAERLFGGR
jgi:hypothetical chaperone protein